VKVVAVSQRVDTYPDRNERRDALDQRLCRWLTTGGYTAVPVPNPLHSLSSEGKALLNWLRRINPDAVVLSGGNNIGEVPERDNTERALLDYSKQMNMPVLGICRGMQMMAVWANAGLIPVHGHVKTRHRLDGAAPDWNGDVNSFHDIALAECPSGFAVTAKAEDGVIEAIRHECLPWQGWMWHPEREAEFCADDIRRLKLLFGN
jgi:gamma-glutamyl-gamma-aminobutyrate hydrolase PuuD